MTGFEDHTTVTIESGAASEGGLQMPQHWTQVAKAMRFCLDATEAPQKFFFKSDVEHVRCCALGVPQNCPLPDNAQMLLPGSEILLAGASSERSSFLLCAHVCANRWLCLPEPGQVDGGLKEQLFDDGRLVIKDISAVVPVCMSRVRGKTNPAKFKRASFWRPKLEDHASDWNHVVAMAHMRAEEERARDEGRAFNNPR